MAGRDYRRPGELNAREAADRCGYTLRSFYNRKSEIPHRRDHGYLYFTREDLDTFIASQSSVHVPSKGAA